MAYSPASQKKYDDENTLRITLKLNKKTDKDILFLIDYIANQSVNGKKVGKQAAIKKLILKGSPMVLDNFEIIDTKAKVKDKAKD